MGRQEGIFVRAAIARDEVNNSFMIILWHKNGRTILVLDDDGKFVPLQPGDARVLADLLDEMV